MTEPPVATAAALSASANPRESTTSISPQGLRQVSTLKPIVVGRTPVAKACRPRTALSSEDLPAPVRPATRIRGSMRAAAMGSHELRVDLQHVVRRAFLRGRSEQVPVFARHRLDI